MKPRIMFLRDSNSHPVGCLAIAVQRQYKKARYQFSVLNPVDRFDRAVARQLALGRLVEKPLTVTLPSTDANMHDISQAVMKHLVTIAAPSRAIKAAKLWLSEEL